MKLTFRLKLIVGLSVIILFSCSLTGYISYRTHLQLFEEEVSGQYTKSSDQAMAHLDLRIQEMYRITNYIVFNTLIEKAVVQLMSLNSQHSYEAYIEHNQLQNLLRQVKLDAPLIKSLYIYDVVGTNYYFGHLKENSGPLEPAVYQKVKAAVEASSGELIWMRSGSPGLVYGEMGELIAARWMKNRTLGLYGMVVMEIDESLLSGSLHELFRDGKGDVFLYDQRGELVYTDLNESTPLAALPQQSGIREEQGDTYLYAVNRQGSYNWTLVSRISLSALQDKSRIILQISLYAGLVTLALSVLLIILLSHRLARPLRELVRGMRLVRERKFDTRIELHSRDELGFIADSFNTMTANIQSLIQEVYLRQLSEREAELKAIQAQLNPHFLYNTLNGLYWRLYVQEDRETAELVSALSGLMRYSLERVSKDTVLREELQQIRNYLEIQKAFVENRFEADIYMEEEAGSCLVPRLILQPLVENAFVHAYHHQAADKQLRIRAVREGDLLLIEIDDNGCGMSAEQIERLLRPISEEDAVRPSIGIRSVLRRIDLVYGPPYGLDIDSAPGEGTTVLLRLPCRVLEEPQPGQGNQKEDGA